MIQSLRVRLQFTFRRRRRPTAHHLLAHLPKTLCMIRVQGPVCGTGDLAIHKIDMLWA